MNISLRSVTALSVLIFAGAVFAADPTDGSKNKPAAAEKSPDTYPLKTCVVSGEELGSMGANYEYVHKEQGKPDRRVVFCCQMCVSGFKKNPAKYLKEIDDAQAAANAKKKS